MSPRLASGVLFLLVALVTTRALALNQPDGTTIPVPGATSAEDLQTILDGHGETSIQVQRDAAVTPETFNPDCNLTFTIVSRGTARFQDAFGWYNVTGTAPADSDLHVLIPCGATPGAGFPLDVRSDPTYRGGAIGFFLRTPEAHAASGTCSAGNCCATVAQEGYTYYSERRFNPDDTGASPYIHLLIYDSGATSHAFYFAWEDLFGGGDNGFADFVAEVSGIQCVGGGGPCDTGMPGICSAGTLECHDGAPTCTASTTPRTESCNGLDDDCNGTTDDGTGLCPAGQVCDRGSCVPMCVEGACFAGETCSSRGTCVDDACVTVTCPAGQVCTGGACVGACEGVVCPSGDTCRSGRCVDPCSGIPCDSGEVCADGVCLPPCACRGCGAGETCASTGTCIDTACETVRCAAGTVCVAGACVDPCAGAICPRGQTCVMGACVEATPDGGTADTGATLDAAAPVDAVSHVGDAMAPDAADGGTTWITRSRGCSCRTSHAAPSPTASLVLGVPLFAARRRRRRR